MARVLFQNQNMNFNKYPSRITTQALKLDSFKVWTNTIRPTPPLYEENNIISHNFYNANLKLLQLQKNLMKNWYK